MRVLVTRPEPGASKTAARLRELGHAPVLLPLSIISPVELAEIPDAAAFDAVVVTSGNALLHAPGGARNRYGDLPCFAVGVRTAEAAKEAGFADIQSADGDAHDLIVLIGRKLPAGSRVLYLCGQRRRPVLEEGLGRRGYNVTALETYRTDPVDYAPEDVERIAGTGPIDAALVYSPFSAERSSEVAAKPEFAPLFGTMRILCMSKKVANALENGLSERAEIAVSPDEDALLALLGRAH